ncbi:hypothetical protein PtA15_17A390 [Puccinia triticina]|uniref:Uncharacterized protein n=1 Tax=Puccinia triticina TaxID=208348 RepID=A0ABY7D8J8_9BASI|nr:uncharacterized protein PtA15_17A390 [Puccinia triticina]WAQ92908.1 hypothetical protein PtA15_17A390 [Puccinia triticina]
MLILMGLIIEPMTFPNQVNRNGQGLGSFSSQLTGACQPVFHGLNQTVGGGGHRGGGGLHRETPISAPPHSTGPFRSAKQASPLSPTKPAPRMLAWCVGFALQIPQHTRLAR